MRTLLNIFLVVALDLVPSTGMSELPECPGGAMRNSVGLCSTLPNRGGNYPPNIPVETMVLSGFETASIVVPGKVVETLIVSINAQRNDLDGIKFGDKVYYFDILEVTGLYDGRPLTQTGKNRVFSDAIELGLLRFVSDSDGNGIVNSDDVTDDMLGRLRVHSLNEELRFRRLPVEIVLPSDLNDVRTKRGPRADDPSARGVQGKLRPTAIPEATGSL